MNACIIKDLNDNDGQLRFIRSLCTEGDGAGDLYLAIRTAMKLFTVRRNGTSGKIHQRNHLIKDMYETAFADSFERLPWEELTATALSQHARKIATNFRNTFGERPFKARLRAGVKHELSRRGLDPWTNNNQSIVFKAIMENDTDRLQPVMADFVNNIRKILHTGDLNGELPAEPQAIDKFYFENEANNSRVLNMYHFILKNMDAGGRRMLMLGVGAALATLIGVFIWASYVPYKPLLTNRSYEELLVASGALEEAGIPFEITNGNTRLDVPQHMLGRAQVVVATGESEQDAEPAQPGSQLQAHDRLIAERDAAEQSYRNYLASKRRRERGLRGR